MKFSIIINTHNQTHHIHKSIISCINQKYKNFEIIVVDSSKKRISQKNIRKYKSKHFNFKYIFIRSIAFPEMDQMNKVEVGLKNSIGKYILLLDGDDELNINKLIKINELINKKNIFCNQDRPTIVFKHKKGNQEIKNYKYNFFYKFFVNDWPEVYGTSTIVVRRDLILNFFKNTNPYSWKLLAIDAQLILFCKIHYILSFEFNELTYKNIHDRNNETKYRNIFKKKYWQRRNMQHQYIHSLKKGFNLNLDLLITKIINIFI